MSEGRNLDRKLVKEATGKQASDFEQLEVLNAQSRGLTDVKSLNFVPALKRLDLGKNGLKNTGAIASCTALRWLNLANNEISDIKNLSKLSQLQVLNVAHNALSGTLTLEGLPALGAFIANNNAITAVKGLGEGQMLNTVILKANRISTLGKAFHSCSALAKISVAQNQIADLGDSLSHCRELAELRVGHNQLQALPDSLVKNSKLKLVDLGSNLVDSWKDVKVLQSLPKLQSLNLKGCPLAATNTYQELLAGRLPRLQILDNARQSSRPAGKRQLADPQPPSHSSGAAELATDASLVDQSMQSQPDEQKQSGRATPIDGEKHPKKRKRARSIEAQEQLQGQALSTQPGSKTEVVTAVTEEDSVPKAKKPKKKKDRRKGIIENDLATLQSEECGDRPQPTCDAETSHAKRKKLRSQPEPDLVSKSGSQEDPKSTKVKEPARFSKEESEHKPMPLQEPNVGGSKGYLAVQSLLEQSNLDLHAQMAPSWD